MNITLKAFRGVFTFNVSKNFIVSFVVTNRSKKGGSREALLTQRLFSVF